MLNILKVNNSFMLDYSRWFATRMMNTKILALSVLLTVAIVVVSVYENQNWLLIVARIFCLLWFTTWFRLWDDLTDRDYDRIHHPARVLVNLNDVQANLFKPLVTIALVVGSIMLFIIQGSAAVLGLTLLVVFLSLVYKTIPRLCGKRSIRDHLVLTKYPALIALLSSDLFNGPTLLTAILVFLIVAIVDYRDTVTDVAGAEKP